MDVYLMPRFFSRSLVRWKSSSLTTMVEQPAIIRRSGQLKIKVPSIVSEGTVTAMIARD
jgi:hypothetical protein